MIWRPAAIRAVRSFLQGVVAAGLAFLTYLGSQSAWSWVDIRLQGSKLAMALALAAGYGLVSFAQNLLEDNSPVNVPKG